MYFKLIEYAYIMVIGLWYNLCSRFLKNLNASKCDFEKKKKKEWYQ